eukprot:m.208339 g.208339  ORF g.208339 m.208339 type:complete len:62 (+) comp15039_c0_seq2:1667-1852(+)
MGPIPSAAVQRKGHHKSTQRILKITVIPYNNKKTHNKRNKEAIKVSPICFRGCDAQQTHLY